MRHEQRPREEPEASNASPVARADATRNHSADASDIQLSRRDFAKSAAKSAIFGGIALLGVAQGVSVLQPRGAHAAASDPITPPSPSIRDAAKISTRTRFPRALLAESPFVYVSPLLASGAESTCHAELWFAWIDESVVVTVARDRWKAAAISRGLDRARIWVGDHGRWKTWYGGRNEAFRAAPSFDARGELVRDPQLVETLLEHYATKYPDEIEDWRDIMRRGQADGSRVMLRYSPIPHRRS